MGSRFTTRWRSIGLRAIKGVISGFRTMVVGSDTEIYGSCFWSLRHRVLAKPGP